MRNSKHTNLIGHISAGNFGDEMMLRGVIQGSMASRQRFVVHRSHPFDWLEAGRGDLDSSFLARYSLEALRALASGPTVLCGGTTFHDANSGIGSVRQTLAMYLLLGRLAISKSFGFTNQALAIGVGPLRRPLTRLAVRLLAKVALITVRDESSRLALAGLGIRAAIQPDLGFSLKPVGPLKHSNSNVLLVVPCSELQGGTVTSKQIAGVASEISCNEVRLLSFNRDGRYSDVDTARRLELELAAMGIQASSDEVSDSIESVLDEIGSARLVLAGRFHALIACLVQGTDVVASCYHEKMFHLAAEHNIPILDSEGRSSVVDLAKFEGSSDLELRNLAEFSSQ